MVQIERLSLQKCIMILIRNNCCIFFLIAIVQFSSCISAGTHGSIKAYQYNVSKKELEKAVQYVMDGNPLIINDTVKDYYNDDTNYLTLDIVSKDSAIYRYTIRYYGG